MGLADEIPFARVSLSNTTDIAGEVVEKTLVGFASGLGDASSRRDLLRNNLRKRTMMRADDDLLRVVDP